MKKFPVLTETNCALMEMLKTALEVQIGKRVKFRWLDMNTGRAAIVAGNDILNIEYKFDNVYRMSFVLEGKTYWALFCVGDAVKVGCETPPRPVRQTIVGAIEIRWVGTSWRDREEEPLLLEEFRSHARSLGVTVQQLLHSGPLQNAAETKSA